MSGRVALTGSRGFIGRHVAAALSARGDEVVPVPRPYVATELRRAFEGVHAVVHLAGVVSAVRERDYYEGNVESTRIVAQAADEAGAALVHISSLAAAGPAPASAPRTEDDDPRPITTYGRTKLEGERAVQARPRLRWTILRPGVVYGPGDRALRPLFRMARTGWVPLVGNPSAAYTFIYVEDLVRAVIAAVDRTLHREIVFLGHARPVASHDLLTEVSAAAGVQPRLVPVPRILTRAAALAGDVFGTITGRPAMITTRRFAELYSEGFVCTVDRMRDRLGVEARIGLREGLAAAQAWYLRPSSGGTA